MDFEALDFEQVMDQLRSQRTSRDPRARRLASVAEALLETAASPCRASQIYVQGMTALEGTILREAHDASQVNESLGTQVALLEVLSQTIPHVEPSQIIAATLAVPSRVFRSMVSFCQSIDTTALDTEDELGGVSSVLRSVSKACGQIALKLHQTTPDQKIVAQFWKGTNLALLSDSRPKVRKAAATAILEAVVNDETCLPLIRRTTEDYVCRHLKHSRRHVADHGGKDLQELLPLVAFLEKYVAHVETENVLVDVMELLTALIQAETEAVTGATATTSTTDFVALAKQKKRTDGGVPLAVITSLLGVINAALEEVSEKPWKSQFASRAVASLLTAQPTWIFRPGVTEASTIALGRTVWGQTLIIGSRRILDDDSQMEKASKILPVVVRMVLLLAKPSDEADEEEASVAFQLVVDLTQFFREFLSTLKSKGAEKSIEAILLSLEQVLGTVYRPTWAVSLKCFAVCLQYCEDSAYASRQVESLIQHRNDPSASAAAKMAIEDALSTLVQSAGLEKVWSWLKWPKSAKTARERGWILGVLRSGTLAAQPFPVQLMFFQDKILSLARRFDKLVSTGPDKNKLENRIGVIETWKLLPCFLNQLPPDISEHLLKLAITMGKVLEDDRYPELTPVICHSISLLSKCGENNMEMYGEVFLEMPKTLLPLLFKISMSVSQDLPEKNDMEVDDANESPESVNPEVGQKLQVLGDAICSLASIAERSFLQELFKKLMHRLLEQMQLDSPSEAKLSTYLLLSQSLVRSGALDVDNVGFLFRATKPLLHDGQHSTKTLKRAYKLLAEICEKYSSFFSEPNRLEELSGLLKETAGSTQVAARYMRLKCVSRVVEGLEENTTSTAALAKILSVTSEILICLKDPNGKTREAAYELLLVIAAKSEYNTILRILTASLAAETPHMRSAAVMALSRVVYERVGYNEEVQASLPALLGTVLCLMAEDSREVIKSVVGFTRVCVSSIPNDQLEPLLPQLVGSLMKYHKVKERFRPKIKIILKKLVKRFGYEGLMPFVPKSEARLLTHMRKVEERLKRRKLAKGYNDAATKAGFDDFLDSDEEDSDNGRTLVTTIAGDALTKTSRKSKRTRATSSSRRSRELETKIQLPSEVDGNIVDMLGSSVAKRVTFVHPAGAEDSSDDEDVQFNDDGMLVIHESTEDADEEHAGKKRRISRLESVQILQKSNQTKTKRNAASLGRAYKSKKAGGDVKRKDQKFEPYAFVPLNAKAYSKKHRRSAVESMSTVVRRGKKQK